jgi:hypothetical protein
MDNRLIALSTIDLIENLCNHSSACQPIIDYTRNWVNAEHPEDYILAVLPLLKFIDATTFFNQAFKGKTRYEFRKVVEDCFTFRPLSTEERNSRLNELFAINTSADFRQGKMNESYFEFPKKMLPETCPAHFHKTFGAFAPNGEWIGYIDLRFCGEWASTYHILGHKQFLQSCKKGSLMVNLWFEMVRDILTNHPHVKYVFYHLMDVGNPGLQEWKKRVGLEPTKII